MKQKDFRTLLVVFLSQDFCDIIAVYCISYIDYKFCNILLSCFDLSNYNVKYLLNVRYLKGMAQIFYKLRWENVFHINIKTRA